MSTELKPENFEVAADRDGDMSLRCALYGEGCWWDADIRDGRPDADLGSLLEVAREHMRTAHATVIEAESHYLPDAGVLYDAMTNRVLSPIAEVVASPLKPPADTRWVRWEIEYPRPWWRRLLGLPAKREDRGPFAVEPWGVGQTPAGGTTNVPESGE